MGPGGEGPIFSQSGQCPHTGSPGHGGKQQRARPQTESRRPFWKQRHLSWDPNDEEEWVSNRSEEWGKNSRLEEGQSGLPGFLRWPPSLPRGTLADGRAQGISALISVLVSSVCWVLGLWSHTFCILDSSNPGLKVLGKNWVSEASCQSCGQAPSG